MAQAPSKEVLNLKTETLGQAHQTFKKKTPHRKMHPHSMTEIHGLRKQFYEDLKHLENSGLKTGTPLRLVAGPIGYFFAYDGINEKDLRIRVADFWRNICPLLDYKSPHLDEPNKTSNKKIKIGFFCKVLRQHTVGLLFYDLIKNLDRSKFEVIIFTERQKSYQDFHFRIKKAADKTFYYPKNIGIAVKIVENQKLDILFYPEIGMDPLTYLVAHTRLAPIQCTSWGHPVTSGLPNMDYFISSKLMEPENAQEHYSEKLVLLEDMPTTLHKPAFYLGDKATRDDFNLPKEGNLYMCPQMPFKIHPDFDEYFRAILEKDPTGHIIMLNHSVEMKTKMLEERFKKKFPASLLKRIHFIPYIDNKKFIDFIHMADVLLDPIHFGSGRSGYEAVFAGTPVVTHPGEFMRSRIMRGVFEKIGVTDTVVSSKEEYAEKAFKCANDKKYRADLSKRLQSKVDMIFEPDKDFSELEDFFEKALAAAKDKKPLIDWK